MLAGAAAEIALAKAAAAYHQKRVEFASVKTIGIKKTTAQEAAERYGIDVPDGISLEMPEWLKERAKEEITKSFEGEWWDGIGETTRDDLMNTIKRSLENGLSIRKVADEIMSKFGGDQYPRYRANNIARTELSNAMNSGHAAGIERLQEETGLPMGKEWVSVMGPTTRITHADTDGQQTDTADGNFNLAGYEVPWPAHDSLPPEERCNCQCTVISSFSMSAVDEGDGQPDITDEQGQEDLADDLGDAAPSEDSGVSISPEVDAVEEEYPPANPDGVDSFERQRDSMGVFTTERQALHAAILAELEAAAEVAESPEYLLMGGGPASGKSTLIKSGEVSLPAKAVHLDSDAIKAKLPEYNAMLKAKDMRAAAFAHEESSYLAKLASQKAFSEQKNVVLDGTGNSSLESLAKKVNAAKAKGFTVRGEYATCSTEEALKRNLARAAKTGRLPPEDMLKYTHASVSKVLPEAIEKGLFDELRLWDTEHLTKGQPTLVVSAKGTDLTVHNQELWDSFKAKAKELEPKPKAEPEPPAKPEVGKVTYGHTGKEDTLKALAKTLGEAATLEDAAALAGSQAGAEVRVVASDIGGISISTEHEKFASRRIIRYDAQEKENVMRNVYFYIKEGETGKGLGTKVLSQQVEQAAAFGINKIKTHAARDDDSQDKMNGYYTWPRLGYTGPIKGQEFSQKIFDYADANGLKEIGDFMKTPEHRAWWKANGESFDGEFDTRPGSQSRKVLEEYVRQKAASGTKSF